MTLREVLTYLRDLQRRREREAADRQALGL